MGNKIAAEPRRQEQIKREGTDGVCERMGSVPEERDVSFHIKYIYDAVDIKAKVPERSAFQSGSLRALGWFGVLVGFLVLYRGSGVVLSALL